MATVASIAIRRANAETAIKKSVSALAEKHGVKVEETGYHVRNLELRRVVDLESVAANLGKIVEAFAVTKKAAKEPKTAEDEVEIIEENPKLKAKKK